MAALWRYPVKSMGGEALHEAEVSWHGLAGDRRWAFIRDGVLRSGFPWLTIRERPDMGLYRPYFAEPARPDTSPIMVRTPSGDDLDVVDPRLAAELGPGTRVIKQDVGVFDTMPLSLLSTQSVAAIGTCVGKDIDATRFRPNLLIKATGNIAFPEDGWVGSLLRIGSLRMRIDKRDGRCVMVNLDPVTTESDPRVLKAIVSEREGRLGVYGTTVAPGRAAVGDPVFLEA